MRSFFSSVLEIVEIAFIAIAAVFLIRSFLIQPFLVSGSSMAPNFADGDYLLVDQLTYKIREPLRGEVAVFHYDAQNENTYFIKRIVGVPGDRVKVQNGEVVIINDEYPSGVALTEEYLPEEAVTSGSADVTLGENQYFVLGDNRSYSFDSRSWGTLDGEKIVGLVRFRLWPPRNVTVFASPSFSR